MKRGEKSAEAVKAMSSAGRDGLDAYRSSDEPASSEGPNGEESKPTVSLESARHQKSQQMELPLRGEGEARPPKRSGEAPTAMNGNGSSGAATLMEGVVERGNVKAALKRVRQNKGSPGVDGMNVNELSKYLADNWEAVRTQLLEGTYQPKPVREVEIPKSGGGVRKLGIPSALDRFVQQSILQVLQPMFDPSFSEHSYGFRPGRNAHQAVCEAQRYIQAGKRIVVDLDLEKFFDRVCHDKLMGKLAKRIGDKRMLGLIRRYLDAGIMANGVVMERHEGVPQGGPLSPLLANVFLDEVDKELESRGVAFVRYADDLNAYVGSQRAGEDLMETLKRLYSGLSLRINETKSAVARPEERKFLGFTFWHMGERIIRRIAPKALKTMKERVRRITRRSGGRSIKQIVLDLRNYLRGWKEYFRLAETPSAFRDLDTWIRHRLRMVQLKQWKRGRTVYRELQTRGVPRYLLAEVAARTKHWWRTARHRALNIAMPNSYFDELGVPKLAS